MHIRIINPGKQFVTLIFKVKTQGHSANALKSSYKLLVAGNSFYTYTHKISWEQNVTLTSKVKGPGHSAYFQGQRSRSQCNWILDLKVGMNNYEHRYQHNSSGDQEFDL